MRTKTKIRSEINSIVCESRTANEALQKLYKFYKSQNRRVSIQYLSSRAGISSKGYLSDVLQGRRSLNRKYFDGVIAAFDLEGLAARLVLTLLQLHQEKDVSVVNQLQKKVLSLRKRIQTKNVRLPNTDNLRLVMIVFCTLGTFDQAPTMTEVHRKLSDYSFAEIESALNSLMSSNLVNKINGRFKVSTQQAYFEELNSIPAQKQFIRDCLGEASDQVVQFNIQAFPVSSPSS